MDSPQRFDVAILIGSDTDKQAFLDSKMTEVFVGCGVRYEVSTISADRNDEDLTSFCQQKIDQGVKVFVAVAGLLNILAGSIVVKTKLSRPVIGVGLGGGSLAGQASLFSLTFKPRGTPVATTGLDKHGLINAAWFACQIVALTDIRVAHDLLVHSAVTTPVTSIGWESSPLKGA